MHLALNALGVKCAWVSWDPYTMYRPYTGGSPSALVYSALENVYMMRQILAGSPIRYAYLRLMTYVVVVIVVTLLYQSLGKCLDDVSCNSLSAL